MIGNETRSENLAEVAHDTCSLVTAFACYCDLLDEPGVLAVPYQHYCKDLRLLVAASRRLLERLYALDDRRGPLLELNERVAGRGPLLLGPNTGEPNSHNPLHPTLINDLARELYANRNLLAALAGPSIKLMVDATSCALPVRMVCEDLTRVLVNLVKNAVEAMPTGGTIRVSARACRTGTEEISQAILKIEDNGPGIPTKAVERVFEPGFTIRSTHSGGDGTYCTEHRGIGLSITRSIVESAGGRIRVTNSEPTGACFQIDLPVRTAQGTSEDHTNCKLRARNTQDA